MANPSGPATSLDALNVAGVPTMGMGAGIPTTTGNVFFVNSVTGSNGNTGAANNPFATIAAAYAKCVANNGDIVVCEAGHAETISAAAGIALGTAGVTVVGLGEGDTRPTLTFTTSTAATLTMTAASNQLLNFICTTSIDQIVSPIVVSAASCTINIEWRDGAANKEALRAILTTAAANNLTVNLVYKGFTAGTHGVNAIRLVGGSNAVINVDYFGILTTAVVEFLTTAVINAQITGYFFVSGITNLSRDVVDTVTGSTWFCSGFDGAAGISFDGGSGKALAGNDVTTVIADLAVPTADVTTNALERDVIGNKTDAGVTAVGTTKSLLAYIKGLVTMNTVQTADATNNAFAGDVVGNKTDAVLTAVGTTKSILAYAKTVLQNVGFLADTAVYVPGTTNSLLAYMKGSVDLQENVAVTTAAVMTNGLVLFTVAGGPIEILSLMSICQTANDGTASTLQYQSTGTLGTTTQTISGASASLATAAAGTTVVLQGNTLAAAPLVNANAANITAVPGSIVAPAGSLKAVIGTGSTTGTWSHFLRYRALAKGVTVTAAF